MPASSSPGTATTDPSVPSIIPEAHFKHPTIEWINRECFGHTQRSAEVTAEIHEMQWVIKEKLHAAIKRFELDLIIAENCVTIPMNLPLGLAVVETVMETGLGCIAHHHDFVWERERFLVNAVDDYLRAAFPPGLPQMQHIAINSLAAQEFSRRIALPCRVIPNVMDFAHPPAPPDDVQPAVSPGPRPDRRRHPHSPAHADRAAKGHRTHDRVGSAPERPAAKLVISHSSGDEGDAYADRVLQYARLLNVPVILAAQWIAPRRHTAADGQPRFTIADAYQQADFVTYPSSYEGFGNAFLEAAYYQKPILCNRYSIYRADIEPCGFDTILMDGFLTDDVVQTRACDPDGRRPSATHGAAQLPSCAAVLLVSASRNRIACHSGQAETGTPSHLTPPAEQGGISSRPHRWARRKRSLSGFSFAGP